MKIIKISNVEAGQRVDKFIRKYLNHATLSYIYTLFRKKYIKVNNKKIDISYHLQDGDQIQLYLSDQKIEELRSKSKVMTIKSDLKVIYQDEQIIIVNKPIGVVVQSNGDESALNLSQMVLGYLKENNFLKEEYEGNFLPSPAHRLDRNTSGIIIFGKTIGALQALFELFKSHDKLIKTYLALVVGHPDKKGRIESYLKKDAADNMVRISNANEGKKAILEYKVVKYFNDCSLLEIKIFTGRTHQIRVQMASIKHPVVGDAKYGDFKFNHQFQKKYNWKNQFLHAYKFEIVSSENPLKYLEKKEFIATLDNDKKRIIDNLEDLCAR